MTLATQLTLLITSFLPLLLTQEESGTVTAGQSLGETVSKSAGDEGWVQAQQIWKVLEPVIQKKPLAIAAARTIAEDLLDEEAQAIFYQQLEKVLAENLALAHTLAEIVTGKSVVETNSASTAVPTASAINQTVTGDRKVVVGQAESVAVDQSQEQSHRQLEIGGNVQGNTTIIVGDGNTIAATRPTGTVNPFGVPYSRNRYFTGREDVLSQLHEQLMHSGTAAMTQVQAISGLGGIGKTQTAVEYAYRYHYGAPEQKPVYEYVFWVNADTQVNLSRGFAGIAEQVAVPDVQTMQQEQRISAVRSWLNGHDRWLLIFDNADTPDWLVDWMPTNPKGTVLITSRASVFDQLGIQTPIALDVLPEAEALTLLFERTGIARTDTSENEAIQLNQALDGLPLALEQASAYILRQKIDFGLYLRAYRSRGLTQLEKEKAQTGRYPSSVLKTWQLNMAAVRAENPAASSLLELSAFLAPDEIPCWLLTNGVEAFGSELLGDYLRGDEGATTDEAVIALALRELLSLLSRYSLIRWDKTPDTYSLHRLVQAVVHSQLGRQVAADWIAQATAAIAKAYPGQDFEQWPQCEQLLPHQLRVIEQALADGLRSEALGDVCNQTGFFLKEQGRYDEAEPLYLESLNIRKAELGERHPDTASSLHNLAGLYRSQGRYDDAEPLFLESLNIRKAELGKRHPDTVNSLNDLAGLYRSQGRYDDAEPLFLESLNIRKAELGERHPYTASSLNNLALLYKSQGRYDDAEPLYLESLNIHKAELGERHPDTATSINNLALLYKSQGRYDEAEPLFLKSLNIRKAELGERHPDTATSLNNLAELYRDQGRYDEAEPLYLESLNIRKAELGERHPETASSLHNLAGLYRDQGRYDDAEPLYLESLNIRKAELGECHPHIASSLNNLALLYKSQNRYDEAEPLFLKSLNIRKAELRERHPYTAISLNNLAELYRDQDRYDEAEPLFLESLNIRKAELGERHPDTANSLFNLAALYYQTQRLQLALSYIQQAMDIYIPTLGPNHPTAQAANHWLKGIEQALSAQDSSV